MTGECEGAPAGRRRRLRVVGLGASAGGLDALKRLFGGLPPCPDAAFVVVQHLDPEHPSSLAEILSRVTRMPVLQAKDHVPLVAGQVFVIPPGKDLTVAGGTLRLSDPVAPRGRRMPIDGFLESLAVDSGEDAVAVILSGNGHDGSGGIREVKAHGGVVMVEDPELAEYDGMPRNALAGGLADCCLGIDGLATTLGHYLNHPGLDLSLVDPAPAAIEDAVTVVIGHVRSVTGIDIGCFSETLIRQRLERRVAITAAVDMVAYLGRFRDSEREVRRFVRELLVQGARFFAQPELFRGLQERVMPELIAHLDAGETLRAWVPGCGSGEGAYSLAMALTEAVREGSKTHPIQIFATDLDRTALDRARAGHYRAVAIKDIPSGYATRYLKRDETGVTIGKGLKDSVLVGEHHPVGDPPFSRLHLVYCDGLLTRLNSASRAHVLRAFHFALREGGFLMLGPNERFGGLDRLFERVGDAWPIFRWCSQGLQDRPSADPSPGPADKRIDLRVSATDRSGLPQWIERELLRQLSPVVVLVDENWNTLFSQGATSRYLEVSAGSATHGLIALTRRDLRLGLRAALKKAARDKALAVVRRLAATGPGPGTQIWAWPVSESVGSYMVCFMDDQAGEPQPPTPPGMPALVGQLEYELRVTREDLQGSIEEIEGVNEALRGANEEVLSMNEELQSANEELETSKEELQSLNEELTTLNHQLVDRVAEQEVLNNDLENLLSSTDIATLFLDAELRIRRYTPRAVEMFALIQADLGRNIADVAQRYTDGDLRAHCRRVMRTMDTFEHDVLTSAGNWFTLRIVPYLNTDRIVDGVVLTFADVSTLKAAHAEAQRRATQMRIIADALPVLIAHLDGGHRFRFVNAAHADWFGEPPERLLGRTFREVIGPEVFESLRLGLEASDGGEIVETDARLQHVRLGERSVRITWVRERDGTAEVCGNYVLIHDVTEQQRTERALVESRLQLQTFIEQAPISMAMFDRQMRYLSVSRRWTDDFLSHAPVVIGRSHYALVPDVKAAWRKVHQDALGGVSIRNDDDVWERADGSRRRLRWSVQPWRDEQGGIGGIIIASEDITRFKAIEAELRASQRDLNRAQAVGSIGSWRLNVQSNELLWSPENHRIFGIPPGTPLSYESFLSVVHPLDRHYVDSCWKQALQGTPYDIEHRLLVADRVKWVREKAELEFDDHGVLLGGFGITQDITRQRETEIELQAANERLAAIAAEREAHLAELSNALSEAEVRERDRLYEVIHDHIQPLLVAARLGLSSIGPDSPPERVLTVVGDVRSQITSLIQSARTLSVELSPPQIREGGLIPALESLVRWVRANHGLTVHFDPTGAQEPISVTIRLLCFKAVRELLMNVVKYAGVDSATLTFLPAAPGRLAVEVRDEGAGLPGNVVSGGTGLANIARRLEMVGGTLRVESPGSRGVTALVEAPLDLHGERARALRRTMRGDAKEVP
ncbi:MAG: PAS domain-containing protein [Rhodocyclaceae bacterium]|nr:PAS domain-containing protein [Rhodocyclaceae bacterium]